MHDQGLGKYISWPAEGAGLGHVTGKTDGRGLGLKGKRAALLLSCNRRCRGKHRNHTVAACHKAALMLRWIGPNTQLPS